jgi:two-component system response regulator AlgR
LRVLLVDDEPLARLRMRTLLGEVTKPLVEVVGEAGDGAQALQWLQAHECDLVLLDIRMPGLDGKQLAAQLRGRARAPAVVFVTAHAEHALAAFELEAVDYLTKPVRRERLQDSLQRVALRLQSRPMHAADTQDVLVISDRGRVLRLPLDEVLYLKAELKYVTLRTANRSYVIDDALSDLEQRLGDRFIRIHRNALVARGAVRALQRRVVPGSEEESGAEAGWAVQVAPIGEWLAVSRRQVNAVREALEGGVK